MDGLWELLVPFIVPVTICTRRAQTSSKAADTLRKNPFENSCIRIVIQISTNIRQFVARETSHPLEKLIKNYRQLIESSAKFVQLPVKIPEFAPIRNHLLLVTRTSHRPKNLVKNRPQVLDDFWRYF